MDEEGPAERAALPERTPEADMPTKMQRSSCDRVRERQCISRRAREDVRAGGVSGTNWPEPGHEC
jgi:hypothetical protein